MSLKYADVDGAVAVRTNTETGQHPHRYRRPALAGAGNRACRNQAARRRDTLISTKRTRSAGFLLDPLPLTTGILIERCLPADRRDVA
nr:hypothetical protein [Mycobacterium uberis]